MGQKESRAAENSPLLSADKDNINYTSDVESQRQKDIIEDKVHEEEDPVGIEDLSTNEVESDEKETDFLCVADNRAIRKELLNQLGWFRYYSIEAQAFLSPLLFFLFKVILLMILMGIAYLQYKLLLWKFRMPSKREGVAQIAFGSSVFTGVPIVLESSPLFPVRTKFPVSVIVAISLLCQLLFWIFVWLASENLMNQDLCLIYAVFAEVFVTLLQLFDPPKRKRGASSLLFLNNIYIII